MGWEKLFTKEKTGEFTVDEQTGKVFESETESLWDILAAIFSVVYLIAMLVFLVWQLLDISTGQMRLLKRVLQENASLLTLNECRMIVYAIIGGGLGGIVNGFRSILSWHADRKSFGWRHIWKYIILPLLGAILAAIVYALTRAGIVVVGGKSSASEEVAIQAFAAFSIGALSGYGSQKVFVWLDDHVNRLFQISPVPEVKAPSLKGKTKQEAENALRKLKLNLGVVSEQISGDASEINKVVGQSPSAGTKVSKASTVDIIIAVQK